MKFVCVPTVFFLADGSSSGLDILNTVTLLSNPLKIQKMHFFINYKIICVLIFNLNVYIKLLSNNLLTMIITSRNLCGVFPLLFKIKYITKINDLPYTILPACNQVA